MADKRFAAKVRVQHKDPIEVESGVYISGRGKRRVVVMDCHYLSPCEAINLAVALTRAADDVRKRDAAGEEI